MNKPEGCDFLKKINRFTIQLHERDQSFALKKFYEWSHLIYVSFEENPLSLQRKDTTKLLQLTEKEVISKPNAICKDDEKHNPDMEMTSLITRKIKCNLPWSNLKMDQFDDCKTEEDFESYLKEIIEEQDAIERIPKKCRYKIWRLTHWAETSRNGTTSVNVDLLSTEGEVFAISFHVRLFKIITTSFAGQLRKRGLCLHFRILYWSPWRIFRIVPRWKYPWIL